MEKNLNLDIFYGLKGSLKNVLVLCLILISGLTSCSKDEMDETIAEDSVDLTSTQNVVSTNTSIEEIQFTAIALIQDCHGENIRFTGTIENRVTSTTDARGVVHYTRSFRTKGMTGVGIIGDVPTGTEYEVLGGAEMFAIKDAVLNPDGTLNLAGSIAESHIVIHQGTLVFRNLDDRSIVVARHIIRKVPGSNTTINEWRCGGK